MNPWIKTDDTQWVQTNSENEFVVLDVTVYEEEVILHKVEVDISKFNDEDMNAEIRGYYDSLEQVKQVYLDSWKQIVAEIIAENTKSDSESDESFDSLDGLYQYLEKEYGIKNN